MVPSDFLLPFFFLRVGPEEKGQSTLVCCTVVECPKLKSDRCPSQKSMGLARIRRNYKKTRKTGTRGTEAYNRHQLSSEVFASQQMFALFQAWIGKNMILGKVQQRSSAVGTFNRCPKRNCICLEHPKPFDTELHQCVLK